MIDYNQDWLHELYFQGIETIHANLAEKDDKILDLESAIKTKEYENEVCICGVTRKANRIAGKWGGGRDEERLQVKSYVWRFV